MSKSKQFNFYVNPTKEKEIYEHLTKIPRMVRSHYIKELIRRNLKNVRTNDENFIFTQEKQENTKILSGDITEIDIDDL